MQKRIYIPALLIGLVLTIGYAVVDSKIAAADDTVYTYYLKLNMSAYQAGCYIKYDYSDIWECPTNRAANEYVIVNSVTTTGGAYQKITTIKSNHVLDLVPGYVNQDTSDPILNPSDTSSGSGTNNESDADEECSDGVAMGWLVCPLSNWVTGLVDYLVTEVVFNLLQWRMVF